jgi:hypothetical protein
VPSRKPNETLSQFAIRVAWEYGHFWSPDNPEGSNISFNDLANLKPSDPVVVQAMISLAKMDSTAYTKLSLVHHGRPPSFDGDAEDPAMAAMVESDRCPIPDYLPPPGTECAFEDPNVQAVVEKMQKGTEEAIASGGWPNCHGAVNYHCMAIRVNPAGMNPKYAHLWKKIMQNVQKANCEIGLLMRFIGMDGKDLLTGETWTSNINSELTFVQSSSGWIGLAIVGQSESCGSKIWLKLLATYTGGNTDPVMEQQISALLLHEGGHNMGLMHTNGGIMNPSMTQGNPVGQWPPNDPSRPRLRSLYSGVPVPIPGGGTPNPNPNPVPDTLEKRVRDLEVRNIVNEVTMQWCVSEIRKLKGT